MEKDSTQAVSSRVTEAISEADRFMGIVRATVLRGFEKAVSNQNDSASQQVMKKFTGLLDKALDENKKVRALILQHLGQSKGSDAELTRLSIDIQSQMMESLNKKIESKEIIHKLKLEEFTQQLEGLDKGNSKKASNVQRQIEVTNSLHKQTQADKEMASLLKQAIAAQSRAIPENTRSKEAPVVSKNVEQRQDIESGIGILQKVTQSISSRDKPKVDRVESGSRSRSLEIDTNVEKFSSIDLSPSLSSTASSDIGSSTFSANGDSNDVAWEEDSPDLTPSQSSKASRPTKSPTLASVNKVETISAVTNDSAAELKLRFADGLQLATEKPRQGQTGVNPISEMPKPQLDTALIHDTIKGKPDHYVVVNEKSGGNGRLYYIVAGANEFQKGEQVTIEKQRDDHTNKFAFKMKHKGQEMERAQDGKEQAQSIVR